MKEVVQFVLKGIVKSKYLLFALLAMIVVAMSLLILNQQQPSSTLKEFESTVLNDKSNLNFIIGKFLLRESELGLDEEQQISLDSLLIHENYLKEIIQKVRSESLDFVTEQKRYIEEYQTYTEHSDVIVHSRNNFFDPLDKIELLEKHQLPYLEEKTPWNTSLFTKQLFQIFFSPVIAFLFLLLFIYKYISDRDNQTFEFLKLNSLSPTSIYYGYLIPFIIMIVGYAFFAALLSFLPVLLTGNINTIHYPIDVNLIGESNLVYVWKWLIYMPIGWSIFVSILLVFLMALLRMRLSMGLTLTLFASLPLAGYFIFTQFKFSLFNPIHLIFFYEENLLSLNRFIFYLLLMFCLLVLCLIALYPIFNMKNLRYKFNYSNSSQKKQYIPKKKWKLIQFEYIKSKRKNMVLFNAVILFLIIGGTLIYVNQQYVTLPKKYTNIIDGLIDTRMVGLSNNTASLFSMETESEILLAKGEFVEGFDEEIASVKKKIELANNDIKHLNEFYDEIEKGDFTERFNQEVFFVDFEHIKEISKTLQNRSGLNILASIEQNRILDEKNITPWKVSYLLNTKFYHPKEFINDEIYYKVAKANYDQSVKYDNSALFFLYKYFDWNIMWLALAAFVILMWTSISAEYRPTLSKNFLLTKPISFKSVYVSKWVYNLFITYSLLLGVLGVTLLVGIVFGGLGESQYPMLVYSLENYNESLLFSFEEGIYFHFESLLMMIVKSGLLIVGHVFFLNSLFSLVGRWFRNQYATIMITLLLTFSGYFLANYDIEASWIYLNPFIYFDTWNVIDGWSSIEANSSKVNFVYGTNVLFSGGLLLFIAGLLGRKRK
ncbi:hypothetical protein H9649_13065 [Sporosarcina sp. Sa2YVA2]|uniref:ABC transporter permease n=1 Tax=Sporosarcina quadrami TaxID=2762234 RepID=A0ABR8UBW2_9BACL|nr:ABC transporter permease subunit [Sporosarcina quadrami]MBD7985520.1 hypothetical protein [Sporosarcina quadrami]